MTVAPSVIWLLLVHAAATLFDAITHRRLTKTNWVRTAAWSARGVLACVLLVVPR